MAEGFGEIAPGDLDDGIGVGGRGLANGHGHRKHSDPVMSSYSGAKRR
jgi:hypothetical protein